jgi:hypothetical protein
VSLLAVIVYCYPRTGVPGQPLLPGWDAIPGARGCTPETCAFRDHHKDLQKLGAEVFGLSTQTTEYQKEMVDRLHVPFEVLSDVRSRLRARPAPADLRHRGHDPREAPHPRPVAPGTSKRSSTDLPAGHTRGAAVIDWLRGNPPAGS